MAAQSEPPAYSSAQQQAWAALLALRDAAAQGGHHGAPQQPGAGAVPLLLRSPAGAWQIAADAPSDCLDLLSLYLPLCARGAAASWVVAHLGQSLDGCIATHGGDSCFVTGPENIAHLHRMRALADAVVVGAGTIASDDPKLTTRLVPGPNPVRVVLDPKGRLHARYGVFTDAVAPTLLCTHEPAQTTRHGHAEVLQVPGNADGFALAPLVQALAARGLRRVFIEGGGVTVSRFLSAGLLTRLQITVAPLIIGQGRPGIRLPRTARLSDALRVSPRIFRMGDDVLYDLDLTAS